MPKSRPESQVDPGSCGTASRGAAEGGARPDPERSSSRRPGGPGATLDELRQRLEQLKYRHVAQAIRARAADPAAGPGPEDGRAACAAPREAAECGPHAGAAPSRPDSRPGKSRGRRTRAPDTDPPDPYRKALGLLVRREHSRRELKRKLGVRGIEPNAIEAALDTLEGQGYQDDARFAEMLVRSRIGGGYGPLHIRAELATHGVGSDAIAAAFAEAAPDWRALAREALRRRYGGRPPADRAESLKRAHFLQRRGFDLDSIRAATAAELDD